MNQKELHDLAQKTFTELNVLLETKGVEYSGSEDRLSNFKRGSALTGCTPLQVLFIYLSKHYDAFATYIRDEAKGVDRVRSESIEGRLDDIMNYCLLAKALVREVSVGTQSAHGEQQTLGLAQQDGGGSRQRSKSRD
jgi:hypothetical protein